METTSAETHSLKAGIRPENLRIKYGREIRIELLLSGTQFIKFLTQIGEVWLHTVAQGSQIRRRIKLDEPTEVIWHGSDLAEIAGMLYDFTKWRNIWAVQQNYVTGQRQFFIEIAGPEGLAHRIELTKKSHFKLFQKLVKEQQTSGSNDSCNPSPEGFLQFIESRWRRTLTQPQVARRVDFNAVPNFLEQLTRQNEYPLQITLLNAAAKQTVTTHFTVFRRLGTSILLESPDCFFEWDHSCVDGAWLVRCRCSCGEEILELYGPQKNLVVSFALPALPQPILNLLPFLN